MSDDEIDKAVKEAAEFEAQDKREKRQSMQEMMLFLRIPDTAGIGQVGANLDANDKAEVEADLNAVKSFLDAHQNAEEMTDADVAELKAAQEKLTQSAQKYLLRCMSRHRQHRVLREQVLIWETWAAHRQTMPANR